ncbi:GNAT family N-acetyltransferase [Planococcus lenghuensis]|uniref:N-acetyltransferase domain-containing protein n=1 Tax=Planococcus lenghuensis TaxID=2213202 RepID=A0A1Q2L3D9_9BACL|nr:GNAT family N-acetyltransferase [Planococcus lenghuensis]AQQ54577.1 hypothetical protein B0X71_16685 [Planococcus lenghuensis]
MDIVIKLLEEQDAGTLLDFERRNRSLFEQSVPSRGEAYYDPAVFKVRHEELLAEQAQGLSRFYLIWSSDGQLVGRINLIDIDPAIQEAELGFRIGENFTGKGIGRNAVRSLLAKEPGIKRIKAKTTSTNFASQKVLENNGFRQMNRQEENVRQQEKSVTFFQYILEI